MSAAEFHRGDHTPKIGIEIWPIVYGAFGNVKGKVSITDKGLN